MDQELGRWLIALGGFIVLIGLVLLVGGRLGLGRLPGDLQWTRGNVRIYAPLGTCLLLSLVLTLVVNLIGRR
jgi:hypothetical protein